jgi:hypothetical protein
MQEKIETDGMAPKNSNHWRGEEAQNPAEADDEVLCALCLRPILPDARQSLHHLTPKLKGGKGGPTVLLHQMCHNEIHAQYLEAELARDFDTADKLRNAEKLQRFLQWLANKPAEFDVRTLTSLRRRKKR